MASGVRNQGMARGVRGHAKQSREELGTSNPGVPLRGKHAGAEREERAGIRQRDSR
jgi:hypothetical protein